MAQNDKATLQMWYLSAQASPSASVGYRYSWMTDDRLQMLKHSHEIPHPDARHWKPISSDRAAWEFQTNLAKPPTNGQQEGILRLRAAWNSPDWSPDVAMKSFWDLNMVYFNGYLLGKCRIMWKSGKAAMINDLGFKDAGYSFGWTYHDRKIDIPTAKILLNAETCLKNAKSPDEAKRETFGTLVHEMIHAYEVIRCTGHPRCDLDDEEDDDDDDAWHGPNFEKCATALHLRTAMDIGFGVRWLDRPEHLPCSKPRRG